MKMKDKKVVWLVQTAIMITILLIMAYTPLGYLNIGLLSITLLTIPVCIGAVVISPLSGLILGAVFGLNSYIGSFSGAGFLAMLNAVNPLGVFMVCVPTRILVGLLTGLIFKAVQKADKTRTICYYAAGLAAPLLNTILFMSMLVLFFYNSEYVLSIRDSLGANSVFAFVFGMVGLNGIVEMIVGCAVGGTVSKVLSRIVRRQRD